MHKVMHTLLTFFHNAVRREERGMPSAAWGEGGKGLPPVERFSVFSGVVQFGTDCIPENYITRTCLTRNLVQYLPAVLPVLLGM